MTYSAEILKTIFFPSIGSMEIIPILSPSRYREYMTADAVHSVWKRVLTRILPETDGGAIWILSLTRLKSEI